MSTLLGARAAKAYIGALSAALAALGTALADEAITSAEWIGAAGAAVIAFGAVYFTENAKEADASTSTPQPARMPTRADDLGAITLEIVLTALVVVVLIVLLLRLL